LTQPAIDVEPFDHYLSNGILQCILNSISRNATVTFLQTKEPRVETPLSIKKRPVDFVFVGFWAINLFFITYIVDLEQLVIADPSRFDYPVWPLPCMIDMVHWWARNFDPVILARPAWWRMTIWIDVIGFGPFYAAALFAFIKGKNWIRVPALVWSGLMFANVTIILGEEFMGPHKTPAPGLVLLVNLPWLLFPIATMARVGLSKHLFHAHPDASKGQS
jgi:hypothetical protein